MSSNRISLLAAAAALTLATTLLVPACKKESLPAGEVTPEVSSLLGHLPGDAAITGGVNLAKARESEIYRTLMAKAMPAPPPELAAIQAACGLDPMTAVDQLVVTSGTEVDDRIHLAVRGSFTKDGIAQCIAKAGDAITITEEEALTVYQADGKKIYAHWPAADTVIASLDRISSGESMKKLAGGGPTASGNKDLMGFVSKVDTSSALWAAGPFPEAMRAQLVGVPGAPKGFFLTVNPAGDGAVILLGLQLDSEDLASATADQIRQQKGQLKSMLPDPKLGGILDRLEVLQSGSDVAFKLQLSAADIEHLVGMASGMLGSDLGL